MSFGARAAMDWAMVGSQEEFVAGEQGFALADSVDVGSGVELAAAGV